MSSLDVDLGDSFTELLLLGEAPGGVYFILVSVTGSGGEASFSCWFFEIRSRS